MKSFTVYAIGEDQLVSLVDMPGYSHAVECNDRYVGGHQLPQKARRVYFSAASLTAANTAIRNALCFRPWSEHHSARCA